MIEKLQGAWKLPTNANLTSSHSFLNGQSELQSSITWHSQAPEPHPHLSSNSPPQLHHGWLFQPWYFPNRHSICPLIRLISLATLTRHSTLQPHHQSTWRIFSCGMMLLKSYLGAFLGHPYPFQVDFSPLWASMMLSIYLCHDAFSPWSSPSIYQ